MLGVMLDDRRPRRTPRVLLALSAPVAVLCLAGASSAQEGGGPVLKLQGFALNLTGVGGGRSGHLEVTIERWTKDDEREQLRKSLADGGVAALADDVRRARALLLAPALAHQSSCDLRA